MTSHPFNGLTPAEAERLAMLAEECAEVIHVVGKILRHGYASCHPETPTLSNKDLLTGEIKDVLAIVSGMGAKGDVEVRDSEGIYSPKCLDRWNRKLSFTHHQGAIR